jgi:hypothetical protein
MYHKSQLTRLFELIAEIQGSEIDHDACTLRDLNAEADRLKALEQVVVLGSHEHRHGATHYVFLKPVGTEFHGNEFEAKLQEDFEEDKGETLEIIVFQGHEIEVIEPTQNPA